MAAYTGNQIIAMVQGNLGARDSGKIGIKDVSEAIMDFLNDALFKIPLRLDVPALQVNETISVTTSDYKYALPTSSGRIKNVINVRNKLIGEDLVYPMMKLSTQRRDERFSTTSSAIATGRPVFYSSFGGYIEVYPFPDDSYTLYLRVNVYPTKFTASTLSAVQSLGEEFDGVLVEYTTARAFLAIQQTQDAATWFQLYTNSLRDLISTIRKEPDWTPDSSMERGRAVADPQNDPFVKEWNS
jgi:hypothetical protein